MPSKEYRDESAFVEPDESPLSLETPVAEAPMKLALKTKIGFGIGDLGGNLFFTAMGFYSLIFLTDTVGLAAAYAGIAILIGKIWDAVNDPLMGYLTDRTRTRWGRRRPFLLFGAVPVLLSMWLFFSTPDFHDKQILGTIWAAVALLLLNTFYTIINIPYSSLTPELTKDFKERSSLNGYRFIFAVVGTILGAAIVLPIIQAVGDPHKGYSIVGLLFGTVLAVTILITFFTVREPDHSHEPRPTEKFFPTYLKVFKNGLYMRLAFTYMLHLTGLTFVQSILIYYFKYIYHQEGMTTIAMVILLLVAMAFIPVSVVVSRHIGKNLTYQIAFAILIVSCMAIFFLGHILGMTFTLILMVFAGIGIGFAYVPPYAMLPDVVEVDAVRTKVRKEGSYYGMWTFFSTLGVALASSLAGVFLNWSGYVADAVQGPATLLTIRLIVGPIPSAIFFVAILLLRKYPLDEKTYDAIVLEHSAK
jgi:glycoside/pentoside/hexuronide:cation symporter, GPH family